MPQEPKPASALDPAATDETSANARDGARKRRDPDEPAAVVGLGASAGGVAVLQQFFSDMSTESGLAFVVVMHLSPDFESQLAQVLQQKTKMPVVQVSEPVKVKPNHVYVIPPNHQLTFEDSTLHLTAPQQAQGRRVTIDLFFRTLAQAYGQRAVCVILSGTDSDGVIGLKHVRAQGGVTIAQDPEEAEFDSMPLTAIATGMVDWVLPIAQLAPKLMEFVGNEHAMQLPPELPEAEEPDLKVEEAPGGETISDETRDPSDEAALLAVLKQMRSHTGHDFTHYKRATVLRRVARRMQVNSVESIPRYLEFMHKHTAEARALLHDLLISVTHFFRDQASFTALEAHIPQLFAGKKKDDEIRAWVAGCATGEEAYSLAMLLCEHADRLSAPPSIQIFATDIDEQAIHEAREGVYPTTIEADVSPERLRRFFSRDNGRYRVKKDIRDMVLFAAHNLLSDPAFSRLDLVTCRNLLIYLNRTAQASVFDIFHFALRPGGLLVIDGSETADGAHALFSPVDTRHRIYVRRSVPRPTWQLPVLPPRHAGPRRSILDSRTPMLPRMTSANVEDAGTQSEASNFGGQERRAVLFGELHLKLLEQYGPPSVVVNEAHDIVHLSEHAGRYLTFRAGEPSTNLMNVVHPALRIELRTALFQAAQRNEDIIVADLPLEIGGASEAIDLHVRPVRPSDSAHGFFLVLFEKRIEPLGPEAVRSRTERASRELGDELQFLKEQLNATVEQYEASSEELKASNEELHAMNEELRSAAEELETSKEELQSVNEELTTVNHELKDKVEELSRANSDLNNLIASTDLATVFLDRQLRIQRFTPRVREIFNLLPSDIGRPISDITHTLRYDKLIADAEEVVDKLNVIERELRTADGSWFLTRIGPYRTVDDRINSVVLTLVDITARKQAEEELRESELRARAMFEQASVGIVRIANGGAFLAVNPGFCEFVGYREEELLTMRVADVTHPEDYAREEELTRQLTSGEIADYTLEKRYRRKDGSIVWGSMSATFVRHDSGAPLYTLAIVQAIGARKEAEEQLRGSEERLRVALQGAEMATWDYDVAADRVIWNDQHFRLFGLEPDGSAKTAGDFLSFVHPDDSARIREELRTAVEETGVYRAEFRIVRNRGEVRWMSGFGQTLERRDGRAARMTGVMFDITERRGAEQAIRESEERLRTIADNVPQVIWTNEANGEATWFNKRWHEYTGLKYEESAGPGWQAIVHPDDAGESIARWQQAFAQGEVFDAEYRLRGADGEYRWFLGRNVPLRINGNTLSWFGSATDIDDFKQAQARLHEAEEKFRLLVEGAPDYAMFLLDTENNITFWSSGAEQVFGWTPEEAIGQKGSMIFVEEDLATQQDIKELEQALRDGAAPDRRWHVRKDGTRLWLDGFMRRLNHEDGTLRGFAKVAREATDQKMAEEKLREAYEDLEQRVHHRTKELQAMNESLEQEMRQRQKLEREILEVSESERARISQDLHDSLCQELTATAFLLKSRARSLGRTDPEAGEALTESAEMVNRNAGMARDLARGLHPLELGSGGLASALRELASRTSQTVSCKCDCPRSLRVPNENVAVNLYRIAQEAVTNALKHAKPSEIVICIERQKDDILLVVSDNGTPRRRTKKGGLGIQMMQYRANVSGGMLKVESKQGKGTKVTCRVPAKPQTTEG